MKRLTFVLFLLLLVGSNAPAQTNDPSQPSSGTTTAPVTTQTHTIYDDGYANVPLQFAFPYYGQTFNNSWMFSNGIISFQDPEKSGLSWSNLSVQQFNNNMGSQFNYSIFPLWTDLINLGGTFQTEGSTQFQRYKWIGISPFYDANRINTFSVELRPDGQIIANYSLVSVNYAGVGMTGDVSKGEYEQIGWYPSTTTTGMVSDWTRYTSGTDLCSSNPLSSPSCPGFADAMNKLTVTSPTGSGSTVDIGGAVIAVSTGEISAGVDTGVAATSSTTGSTTTTATTEPSTASTSSAAQPTQTTASTTQTTAPTATTVTATSSDTAKSNQPNANLSTALSTIRNNATREQAIAAQAVQTAISEASASSTKSQQEATSVAATAVAESTSSAGSSQTAGASSASSTVSLGTGLSLGQGFNIDTARSASRSDSASLNPTPMFSQTSTQSFANALNSIENTSANLSASVAQTVASISLTTSAMTASTVEDTQNSRNMLTDRTNPVNDIIENKPVMDTDNRNVAGSSAVKKNVQPNELAAGVDIGTMAVAPQGYGAYTNFALRDSNFYAPKEVYRNQRVIDNQRLLRQMSSDRLHQEMVDQQYRK